MCVVSDKIKFCTCSAEDLDGALNTWTFFRKRPRSNETLHILGSAMMPLEIDFFTELQNQETLLKRVNERDAFDIDLNPEEGDRLLLSFRKDKDAPPLWYGFEYFDGVWEEESYSVFDWMETHKEGEKGKVYNP